MAVPCYRGPNPVKDDERVVIWKWARDNHIDQGATLGQVKDAINQEFYNGMAKPEWLDDIITGRKTPFKEVANDLWRKQYNRQAIIQQAKDISQWSKLPPWVQVVSKALNAPRSVAVFGHGIVFPITHAGDLVFRPSSWGTFIKGVLRTYKGASSSAFAGRVMDRMAGDELYDLALRSGVDVGPKSHPVGLISTTGGKTGFFKAAARAWDMLTVMRFELWKNQVSKHLYPGMSTADALDIGKNFADWANHATGSGKGPVASVGGNLLFGPKLTQSKLNRLTVDPAKTFKTFANWNEATPGEKAVAWTRLSGATQFALANLGFLGVNAGVLAALGSKDKINISDPTKGDFMALKGAGIIGNVPGLHTEVKTLAKILATAFMTRKELRGESRVAHIAGIGGRYGMAKLTPSVGRPLEATMGEDWMGRPLPWSSDRGTAKKPRLTWGEYAGSIGPIPLEGPIGFVYDQFRKSGMSALNAVTLIKALTIGGLGAPGFHVREDYTQGQEQPTNLQPSVVGEPKSRKSNVVGESRKRKSGVVGE